MKKKCWGMVTKNGRIKTFMGWRWGKDGITSPILTHRPNLYENTVHWISFFFQTFVVISKGKDIFRFSAEDSMWFLSPFSPVRRVAIHVLVHPLFSLIIIVTILLNCLMMILPPSERIESTEWVLCVMYISPSMSKLQLTVEDLERYLWRVVTGGYHPAVLIH